MSAAPYFPPPPPLFAESASSRPLLSKRPIRLQPGSDGNVVVNVSSTASSSSSSLKGLAVLTDSHFPGFAALHAIVGFFYFVMLIIVPFALMEVCHTSDSTFDATWWLGMSASLFGVYFILLVSYAVYFFTRRQAIRLASRQLHRTCTHVFRLLLFLTFFTGFMMAINAYIWADVGTASTSYEVYRVVQGVLYLYNFAILTDKYISIFFSNDDGGDEEDH